MAFDFTVETNDSGTHARCGTLQTPHGPISTPVFMPVGTRGSVKGLTPTQITDVGSSIILANTYHLALRPGSEIVRELGGLHEFMQWSGPILTDSGGFQVFSLATLNDIDDDGVSFKSHIDGTPMRLDPASSVKIQEDLGADIIMAFDECPALPAERATLERAVERTIRWAGQCRDAQSRDDQALFGIVQGGLNLDMRLSCMEALAELDLPGYAVGGLSVGEDPDEMATLLKGFAHQMPANKPRYLMGVGRPIDIVRAIAGGIDMFDCVMPTRNGRNSFAFVGDGVLRLRNSRYKLDNTPIDAACDCYCCQHFSRAYLRHLFLANEMLGPTLLSLHNLRHYHRLIERVRAAIRAGTLAELLATMEAQHAAVRPAAGEDD